MSEFIVFVQQAMPDHSVKLYSTVRPRSDTFTHYI